MDQCAAKSAKSARSQPRASDADAFMFASAALPKPDRLPMWRDVIGRTLTGCAVSAIEDGDVGVDFRFVRGPAVGIGRAALTNAHNDRDTASLRDGDADAVMFVLVNGEARVDHCGERICLRAGEGVMARFDRTTDTYWPDADVMLIRLPRDRLRGATPDFGARIAADQPCMSLLRIYAAAALDVGLAAGVLDPMVDRHVGELATAVASCALPRTRETRIAVRIIAMREHMARHFADPGLSMRTVAAAVGLSERSGHLAFELAGLRFADLLADMRLDSVRERLGRVTGTIADLAFGAGFSDLSHFNRRFRARFGCTPREARALGPLHPTLARAPHPF